MSGEKEISSLAPFRQAVLNQPGAVGSPWRMRAEKSGESSAAFARWVISLRDRSDAKGRAVLI
jgi:hypothetical protein